MEREVLFAEDGGARAVVVGSDPHSSIGAMLSLGSRSTARDVTYFPKNDQNYVIVSGSGQRPTTLVNSRFSVYFFLQDIMRSTAIVVGRFRF